MNLSSHERCRFQQSFHIALSPFLVSWTRLNNSYARLKNPRMTSTLAANFLVPDFLLLSSHLSVPFSRYNSWSPGLFVHYSIQSRWSRSLVMSFREGQQWPGGHFLSQIPERSEQIGIPLKLIPFLLIWFVFTVLVIVCSNRYCDVASTDPPSSFSSSNSLSHTPGLPQAPRGASRHSTNPESLLSQHPYPRGTRH